MCLIKKNLLPRISIKPIVVYKIVYIVSDEIYAPFMLGKYESNIIKTKCKHTVIASLFKDKIEGEGVHAYTNIRAASRIIRSLWPPAAIYLNIIKAIIPPLTFYWLSKNNEEIAATKMILKID